ncbi:hypothetical protein T4B_6337 [Trichinella pseudospiralis]|uniref:Uncharacterized protein n=1 Tax=Trichinella pseudospiralis TaxID=6337 RepID=A0A0V1H044_TRIPS|nr:hypothetical protein T4B_6337 [Trichinella pseudospiralis]
MIRHRYVDHYLHNKALEINFRGYELSEDLLLIVDFVTFKNNKIIRSACFKQAITRINMRYREKSGVLEHSYLSFCLFFCSISCFYSQLTDFLMYRLANEEVAALYPRIQEVALRSRNLEGVHSQSSGQFLMKHCIAFSTVLQYKSNIVVVSD